MTQTSCRNQGCPGHYEERRIAVVEYHAGQPIIVDNVPARVCDECGDELLTWATVQQLEALSQQPPVPARFVPLYHFPASSATAASPADGQERASAD